MPSQMLTEETEANRRIAIDFLRDAARGRAKDAMDRYASPKLVHHNPYFASDAASLATAMDDNHRDNPQKQVEILRTIAEGPLVAVHGWVKHKPDDEPVALVHLLRIEDGKIRELWDLSQEPVADSPNKAGLF
jgi:predicted SnoaL-like aldol condensation-catalyzing enzyme